MKELSWVEVPGYDVQRKLRGALEGPEVDRLLEMGAALEPAVRARSRAYVRERMAEERAKTEAMPRWLPYYVTARADASVEEMASRRAVMKRRYAWGMNAVLSEHAPKRPLAILEVAVLLRRLWALENERRRAVMRAVIGDRR